MNLGCVAILVSGIVALLCVLYIQSQLLNSLMILLMFSQRRIPDHHILYQSSPIIARRLQSRWHQCNRPSSQYARQLGPHRPRDADGIQDKAGLREREDLGTRIQ